MVTVTDELLLARAALTRVGEPADVLLWAAVRAHGPVEALGMARAGQVVGLDSSAVEARLRSADPELDLEVADRYGIRLVAPEHDDWPHFAFAALERTGQARVEAVTAGAKRQMESGDLVPPLALWVRGTGDLSTLSVRSVAIVGSRSSSAYGDHVAQTLSYGLAHHGFVVVSGGAYGIDAVAHRAALAAGGETVIVSAGGIERPYPSSNAALFERAARHGLILSESPPGSAPKRRRFLTRNRLIAALSTGTVIVEAARRSGAINTANHCSGLNRPLMIVPGPVTSATSAGCHSILAERERASSLVTSVDDVLGVIGSASDLPAPPPSDQSTDAHRDLFRAVLDSLDERTRRIFDGFPARRATNVEELAVSSGLSPLDVIRALPTLELSGLVEFGPKGLRIARSGVGRRQ